MLRRYAHAMSVLCFVLGTRPEIIKLAPLLRRCVERDVPFRLLHSGQHYDRALDGIFFEELQLPAPHANLAAAAPSQGAFFGRLLPALEEEWTAQRPAAVIVQGDTNSAFAGAFMAQRMGIPVAHVEAGLRSDDWTMPEEVNRVLIDRLADRLYVPTEAQAERVRAEGIPSDRLLVSGNTVADAVREHLPLAAAAALPADMPTDSPYAIITLHRPALVDHPDRLLAVLGAIDDSLAGAGVKGFFLVHPRTRRSLQDAGLRAVSLHEPVGYLPMLRLLSAARMVVTDSGGLQEETAILHIPCVTVRENTERPETLEAGGNRLAGLDPAAVAAAVEELSTAAPAWKPLYGVDHPSDLIHDDLVSRYL